MASSQGKIAFKEGAQKAQQFSAVYKATRCPYFCAVTSNGNGNGDWSLLEQVMQGIDADSKARRWGKLLLTYDEERSVKALAHVPLPVPPSSTPSFSSASSSIEEEKNGNHATEGMDAQEWLSELARVFPELVILQDDEVKSGVAKKKAMLTIKEGDETSPFKLCDAIVQAHFDIMRKRGLLASRSTTSRTEGGEGDNGDDSDDVDYASAAGIEW